MMSRCTKGTGAVRLGEVPNQLLFSIKSGDSSTFGLKTYFFLMGACVYDELYTYMEWNWNQNFISPRSTFKNKYWMLYLGFLTGWDCATFCNKGTEEFVPGFLLLPFSRNKGTAGQGNVFVPGQRDNRTSRPLETLVISYCSFTITPMADTQVATACAYVTLWEQINYVFFSTN